MTRLPALTAALCLLAAPAFSQTEVEPAPAPVPQVTPPELPGESLPLIPEPLVPAKKPKAKSASEPKKKSETEQQSDDLQARIRYREAKTRALGDPRIQAEWDRAQAAKTDPEKRAALKSYYKMLGDRMVKIDRSVKPRIDALHRTLVWRLDPPQGPRQRRVPVRTAEDEAREAREALQEEAVR